LIPLSIPYFSEVHSENIKTTDFNKLFGSVLKWEALFHLLFWGWFFLSSNVNWTENWFDTSKHHYHVAPLSSLLTPVFFYLNAFWLIPNFLKGKRWYRYFILTIGILVSLELIRSFIYSVFAPSDLPLFEFWKVELLSRNNLIIGLPNSLFIAFFFSFAYRFTKDWIVNNRIVNQLKNEKMSMELSMLKSQVNPHFLFNNLNALDDLIDRNPALAKTYVQHLSRFYRYSIVNMGSDLVPLEEDWKSIDDYLFILSERYGIVYQFEKRTSLEDFSAYMIVPGALQTLVENVVKHNVGSEKEPLVTLLEIGKDGIKVSNPKRPKHKQPESLGTGLKNLQTRYNLMCGKAITISDASTFSVTLPLIELLHE